MSLNRQIASQIYYGIEAFIIKIAGFFGYPDNPGMPFFSSLPYLEQERFDKLSDHVVRFPPEPIPHNIIEVFFGVIPKTDTIKKVFYENPTEGYYNFYIQDFKNLYFLPDWLSGPIQVWFNVSLDTSGLEAIREVLFVSLLVYYNLLNLRLCLYWFLSINPYTYPWIFLLSLVDWTEELLQGVVPVVAGVNVTAIFWFSILGKFADSLNHLVFTMPFLPSEAQRGQTIINGQVEEILMFRCLPMLWYKNGIPNDLREFWYSERPEILKFMQESYRQLDMILFPDSVLIANYRKQITQITSNIPTQILSTNKLVQMREVNNYLIQLNDSLHHFVLSHFDKGI